MDGVMKRKYVMDSDPNNPENYPLDTDGDHVPDSVDTDDDNDGYSNELELSHGTDLKR